MPKSKSHKGLQSRVRVTPRGKVVRRKAGKSHLMSTKNAKRRRALGRTTLVEGKLARRIIHKLGGS